MTTQSAFGYQNILAAVTIHVAGNPAVGRSVNIAQKTHGKVTLVHALKHKAVAFRPIRSSAQPIQEVADDPVEEARSHLEHLKSSLPLVHETRLITDQHWSAIVDVAHDCEADFIVIGTFVHSQLSSLMGETSDGVLHHAGMDVMVVRSDLYNEGNPPKDYTHILAATDLSPQAQTAAEKAAAIADAYKTKLTLFHVIERFPVDRENEFITPENRDPMGYQINLRREALNSIANAIEYPSVNQEVITTNGSASMAVPDYAKEHDADLMVIGSQANYGVKVLLGATADGIVHRAKCDVLVVHSGEK